MPVKPNKRAFTRKEWRIIQRHRTPWKVQRFLNSLAYNREESGETLRTFRGVVRTGSAHCLEAALVAATVLEQHGYPPLLLDIESVDNLDHVVFLFRENGLYGAVGRSRDAGLHGRKPLFSTVRRLVMSYYDPFIDVSGRIAGYGIADLGNVRRCNWRLSERNVWAVERYLIGMEHTPIQTSDRRYRRILRRYQEYRRRYPKRQAVYYANRHEWM